MYIYKIWASDAYDPEDECSYEVEFNEEPEVYELEGLADEYAEEMKAENCWDEVECGYDVVEEIEEEEW